jgi:hypothetical protein
MIIPSPLREARASQFIVGGHLFLILFSLLPLGEGLGMRVRSLE